MLEKIAMSFVKSKDLHHAYLIRRASVGSLCLGLFVSMSCSQAALSQSMGQEQIEEKKELDSMKSEMRDVTSTIDKTVDQLNDLMKQMSKAPDNEIHLMVKETRVEVLPGKFLDGMTYNGKLPGPTIRARVGGATKGGAA